MLRAGLVLGLGLLAATGARAQEPPQGLPRYDLAIRIDPKNHLVQLHERVTWTNRSRLPTTELVFNVYPRFQLPEKDLAIVAKTVELLRESPTKTLDYEGRRGEVEKVVYLGKPVKPAVPEESRELRPAAKGDTVVTHWKAEIDTALVVPLPVPVGPGESVVVELEYKLTLPDKQGRWGVFEGVTTLNHWMPTLAYHDDAGWQPTPFVPWHQPFFLDAGIYTAQISLPASEKIACSGPVRETKDLGDGWVRHDTASCPLRDFTILTSERFQEHAGDIDGVALKVLALPEHAFFAQEMVRIARECMPVYTRWFGPYPYKHFTIVEGFLSVERQRVRRARDDRSPRVPDAAHGSGVRGLSRLARDPAPVVVRSGRHERLCRNLDGRRHRHVFLASLVEPEVRQEQHDARVPEGARLDAEHPPRELPLVCAGGQHATQLTSYRPSPGTWTSLAMSSSFSTGPTIAAAGLSA